MISNFHNNTKSCTTGFLAAAGSCHGPDLVQENVSQHDAASAAELHAGDAAALAHWVIQLPRYAVPGYIGTHWESGKMKLLHVTCIHGSVEPFNCI